MKRWNVHQRVCLAILLTDDKLFCGKIQLIAKSRDIDQSSKADGKEFCKILCCEPGNECVFSVGT